MFGEEAEGRGRKAGGKRLNELHRRGKKSLFSNRRSREEKGKGKYTTITRVQEGLESKKIKKERS